MITEDLELDEIRFLKDQIMYNIYQKILNSPKSASQISFECNIPRSTVYRKLKYLYEKKLVDVSGAMIDDKHRTKLFKKKSKKLTFKNY